MSQHLPVIQHEGHQGCAQSHTLERYVPTGITASAADQQLPALSIIHSMHVASCLLHAGSRQNSQNKTKHSKECNLHVLSVAFSETRSWQQSSMTTYLLQPLTATKLVAKANSRVRMGSISVKTFGQAMSD